MAMNEKTIIHLICMLCLMQFEELKAEELKSGTKRAFLVACDDHLDRRLNLPKAVEDMDKFRQSLLITGYKPEDITFLQGKTGVELRYQPTKSAILEELGLLIKGLKPGDTLVVALNGHGIHPKKAKTSYFVPLDGKIDREKSLLAMDGEESVFQLLREAEKKKAKVLLIVGACRNDIRENVQALNQLDLEDPVEPPEGIAAIYSCEVGQKTYFDEVGGSYFYEHLSKAWKGDYHQSGENITLEMVFKSISDKTFADVRSKYAEAQKPEMRRQYKGEWLINKNDVNIRQVKPGKVDVVDFGKNVKLEMVLVPAGKFMMGSPESEKDRSKDETQHEVTLTKPFYMGKYEVTQEQYEAVMGKNPSITEGAKLPVTDVSWEDCQEFIKKLNKKTNGGYRLPTEAEWEYTCRAGTTTTYSFGDKITPKDANYDESKIGKPVAVGSYKPNAFGLFDMHGNVWEWCEDWYEDYPFAVTDPKGPANGEYRVLRGGSFNFYVSKARSSNRFNFSPTVRFYDNGFRLARTP
jgi:formylglycine-generating enzyme required for sulfatase activity